MYRVLLVEDEEIELETLRDYIDWKKNGISRVFTARNGRRALECLEENMADIVITDIQMPGMSGIELAETIVRRGYPCKIVFLTGYDDFSYIHSAFQVNAVDYLLKPFTIEEVEACLKKVRSELEKSVVTKPLDVAAQRLDDGRGKRRRSSCWKWLCGKNRKQSFYGKISVVYLEKNWKSAGLES